MITLPDCDECGVPVEKMPRCPRCDADELGMLHPGHAYCYACTYTISVETITTGARPVARSVTVAPTSITLTLND